jgi:hypothetical protein
MLALDNLQDYSARRRYASSGGYMSTIYKHLTDAVIHNNQTSLANFTFYYGTIFISISCNLEISDREQRKDTTLSIPRYNRISKTITLVYYDLVQV